MATQVQTMPRHLTYDEATMSLRAFPIKEVLSLRHKVKTPAWAAQPLAKCLRDPPPWGLAARWVLYLQELARVSQQLAEGGTKALVPVKQLPSRCAPHAAPTLPWQACPGSQLRPVCSWAPAAACCHLLSP